MSKRGFASVWKHDTLYEVGFGNSPYFDCQRGQRPNLIGVCFLSAESATIMPASTYFKFSTQHINFNTLSQHAQDLHESETPHQYAYSLRNLQDSPKPSLQFPKISLQCCKMFRETRFFTFSFSGCQFNLNYASAPQKYTSRRHWAQINCLIYNQTNKLRGGDLVQNP